MKIESYVAVAPLEVEPSGGYMAPAVRASLLRDALRGVELGAYDERIVRWMVGFFDDSAMRAVISLIERVRRAGVSG